MARSLSLGGGADRARILLVDDDERNLLAIKTVLDDVADVVVANSGEEALRHLLKGEFAVILLDVYMPGMDGYETAQMIRSREQTKRIPIVFLSAVNKESEHLLRGYAMGAVDYVFKPVDPIVLKSKVAVFVDLFQMRREIQRNAAHEQRLLDVTIRANAEKLRVEQELRLAEQRQAAILESLPLVIYLEDRDAVAPRIPRFVAGNFQALTGYDFDAVRANPNLWEERLHPEDRDRALAGLATRRGAQAGAFEYRWQCADGSWKHFLDQAVLLCDDMGNRTEFAGTILDVTERKALEAQLTHSLKMDAIGKLTGGIAHDFNNLLAAVLGGIGMIERRIKMSDDQKRIVDMTRHAAEQGTELVSRLLSFARRQTLEPARLPIQRLGESVGDLLSHTLGGLVQLDWRLGNGLWPAYADGSQLELALINLIINARDAMPAGGSITVTGENRTLDVVNEAGLEPGDYVLLTVADDGAGIPPDLIDQVLEPFFTTKEMGKGTGLGLSMVYGFAQQSGGTLRIDSEVGSGTRVEIWLPRAIADADSPSKEASKNADIIQTPSVLRILLVDDHAGARVTTAALLHDMGHDVVEACDGPRMLDLLRAAPNGFDLIVSDYAMPLISGAEGIRQAREICADIPAILITGYAEAASISGRPSDVHILLKPFGAEQFAAAIASAVNRRAVAIAAE
ncbi:MAG: response regulator [Sphingomonas sp.]|nr:response regulator [Sphingomonas sp.]